jgi:hypothetical protein
MHFLLVGQEDQLGIDHDRARQLLAAACGMAEIKNPPEQGGFGNL